MQETFASQGASLTKFKYKLLHLLSLGKLYSVAYKKSTNIFHIYKYSSLLSVFLVN